MSESEFRTIEEFSRACEDLLPQLNRYAYKVCRNREDAEDCVSETLLKAYRSWERFRGECKLLTWLCRICSNECISVIRKRRLQTVELTAEMVERIPISETEETVEVDLSIFNMPDEVRQAILLRSEKLTWADIADILGKKESTVRYRVDQWTIRIRSYIEAQQSG